MAAVRVDVEEQILAAMVLDCVKDILQGNRAIGETPVPVFIPMAGKVEEDDLATPLVHLALPYATGDLL